MAVFVLELAFDRDEQARRAVRSAHREYLKMLLDRGSLVMSGPLADDSGALLVYEAADQAAVEAMVAADPYSQGRAVRRVSLRAWTPIFGYPLGLTPSA